MAQPLSCCLAAGAELSDDLSAASLIMGVKAMPKEELLPEKNYLFFSHTIKAQAENMALLDTCLDRRVRLIDYECITADGSRSSPRLVAFGEYAGKAGMINTFRGLGEQLLARGMATPFLSVPNSYMHADLAAARQSVWRMGELMAAILASGLLPGARGLGCSGESSASSGAGISRHGRASIERRSATIGRVKALHEQTSNFELAADAALL